MVDPALGPNVGDPLGSRIMQDFDKCYGQNLTVICMAKDGPWMGVSIITDTATMRVNLDLTERLIVH